MVSVYVLYSRTALRLQMFEGLACWLLILTGHSAWQCWCGSGSGPLPLQSAVQQVPLASCQTISSVLGSAWIAIAFSQGRIPFTTAVTNHASSTEWSVVKEETLKINSPTVSFAPWWTSISWKLWADVGWNPSWNACLKASSDYLAWLLSVANQAFAI